MLTFEVLLPSDLSRLQELLELDQLAQEAEVAPLALEEQKQCRRQLAELEVCPISLSQLPGPLTPPLCSLLLGLPGAGSTAQR